MKVTPDQVERLAEIVPDEDVRAEVLEFIEGLVSPKVRAIELRKDPSEEVYHVDKLTDSVDYSPGQALERETVAALCGDPAWKVKIIRFR